MTQIPPCSGCASQEAADMDMRSLATVGSLNGTPERMYPTWVENMAEREAAAFLAYTGRRNQTLPMPSCMQPTWAASMK